MIPIICRIVLLLVAGSLFLFNDTEDTGWSGDGGGPAMGGSTYNLHLIATLFTYTDGLDPAVNLLFNLPFG